MVNYKKNQWNRKEVNQEQKSKEDKVYIENKQKNGRSSLQLLHIKCKQIFQLKGRDWQNGQKIWCNCIQSTTN